MRRDNCISLLFMNVKRLQGVEINYFTFREHSETLRYISIRISTAPAE